MSSPLDELCRLTATEAVRRLKRGEITPLDLIDAAERRIAAVEPAINALPTLCLDRGRAHAKRLMRGEGREAETEAGWLCGRKLENYLGGSLITAATTLMAPPSIAVPCGFDRHDRPVGLQMVGPHRGEAELLQAAALFEQMLGLSALVPIDPRAGAVPVEV